MRAGVVRERGTRGDGTRPLRRPSAGEVLDVVLGEGLLVLAGLLVVGLTDRPVLWWAVAAGMLALPVRAVGRLRDHEPPRSWGHGGSPAVRDPLMQHHRAGWGGNAGGLDGGGGGGGGDGGGGC